MASFLRKLVDQINPFDNGKSFKNQNPQPASTAQPRQRNIFQRSFDQINPFDDGRNFNRSAPEPPKPLWQQALQKVTPQAVPTQTQQLSPLDQIRTGGRLLASLKPGGLTPYEAIQAPIMEQRTRGQLGNTKTSAALYRGEVETKLPKGAPLVGSSPLEQANQRAFGGSKTPVVSQPVPTPTTLRSMTEVTGLPRFSDIISSPFRTKQINDLEKSGQIRPEVAANLRAEELGRQGFTPTTSKADVFKSSAATVANMAGNVLAGNLASPFKLSTNLAPRVARLGAAGAGYGGASVAATNPEASAKEIAFGAGVGGLSTVGLGAGVPLAAKGAQKGVQATSKLVQEAPPLNEAGFARIPSRTTYRGISSELTPERIAFLKKKGYTTFVDETGNQVGSKPILDNLNPTGGVNREYVPQSRATMPLGENITTLDKTSGKPANELVTIYRGAPKNQKTINAGDFITTNRDLAKSYSGDGNVIETKVPRSHILDDKTEPLGEEYIYRPPSKNRLGLPKLGEEGYIKVPGSSKQRPVLPESERVPSSDNTPPNSYSRIRTFEDGVSTPPPATTKTDLPPPILGESTQVKLNTDRLNMKGGYDAMAQLDEATKETITKMSNKDIQKVAKNAGLDLKTHSDEQVRQKIAEQLNVRQDAVKLMNDAEAARVAGDFEQAELLLAQAAERGRVSRTQGTDVARQLQARRIIANELDTPQQRIFKLLDEAGVNPETYTKRLAKVDFNNSAEVVKAYREMVPAKFGQWLDTLRYNSMLSSPLTQAVNIFGNAQNVAGVAPIEKTIRGTLDAVGGLFGKERKFAAGEGASYAAGVVTNIRNASKNFVDALRQQGKYANPDFEEFNMPLATSGVKGATYKTLSAPMKVLDGFDKFFRTLSEAGEERALKLREKKGIKVKGDPKALAEAEASYRVFQTPLKEPGQGVINNAFDELASLAMKGRSSKNPIVSTISKFTIPFVRTINNISKQGFVDYSPMGFINLAGNADKMTAFTRAAMGTGVFGVSAALIGEGRMTWAEPRDADERARFRAEGKQPYSIKIGDSWVNFSKLTPAVAFPMALTASLHDALESKKMSQSNVDAVLEAVSKYGEFLADQSYAKSVGDTLAALGGDAEAVARTVSNYPQQLVPFRALSGWVARMSDDLERKTDVTQGYFDQQVQLLMQQIPGLRQRTATRDYRGEPIAANNPIFNAFSPVRVTEARPTDPLDAQLDELASEKDPLLNKKQTAQLNKIADKAISEAQRQLINDPDFQSLSPEDKKKKLTKLATDIKAVEKRKYMAQNNVGEYSSGYSGKQSKLTKDQKALLKDSGSDVSSYTKSSDAPTTPREKYEQALEEFNDPDNKLSDVQKVKKGKELKKLEVQKDYDQDVLDLYGMSKEDMYNYITTNSNGNALAEKLQKLDNALYDAGVIKTKKFAKGLAPAKKGGGKGGRKGGRKKSVDYTKGFASINAIGKNSTGALRQIIKRTTIKRKKAK